MFSIEGCREVHGRLPVINLNACRLWWCLAHEIKLPQSAEREKICRHLKRPIKRPMTCIPSDKCWYLISTRYESKPIRRCMARYTDSSSEWLDNFMDTDQRRLDFGAKIINQSSFRTTYIG